MSNKNFKLTNYDVYNDNEILSILLKDQTTKKNIIWATDEYNSKGIGYGKCDYITINKINDKIIIPRSKKSKKEQEMRIKKKAEVFTPSWICNVQNNLIDNAWFGKENVFNTETKVGWQTNTKKISFPSYDGKTWEEYVSCLRIEISCGEAPYLVSRYDSTTGEFLKVEDRIGLLDRKLRVVNENTENESEWFYWVKKAYKSIYGYEWQGDNVFLARQNLLQTFHDYYQYKFKKDVPHNLLVEIAEIVSWNIWQMDGTKYVVPESCYHDYTNEQLNLFGKNEIHKCVGCEKNIYDKHIGTYCKIKNWKTNRSIKYITLLNKRRK